jgi:dihydroflavonol-4-reductase
MLKASEDLDPKTLDNLSFAVADLLNDAGWAEAVQDCTYVLHVASPFPSQAPKHEDELIIPAREGTLRVLRAAKNAGTVKRVVVTSSFAAMGHGISPEKGKPFDETLWTPTDDNNPQVQAYHKSKTLAERAAWDFVEKQGGDMELSVVNPVGIFGPVLGPDFATSVILVQRLLNGALPGCPNMEFGIIDARDVADLHLVAMTHPKAKGERFLAVAPPCMTVRDVSLALHDRMGNAAKRSPTRGLPNFLLRLVALFDPTVALIVPELGLHKELSNEKAKKLLGWSPKWSNADALAATGESLIKFGLVKPT